MPSSEEIKEHKKFINNLKCPICNAQLDGSAHLSRSELYCVANPQEYKCIYGHSTLQHESISLEYTHFRYDMIVNLQGDQYQTTIYKVDLDFPKEKEKFGRTRISSFPGRITKLFTRKMSEKDLLDKIKLFSVFS